MKKITFNELLDDSTDLGRARLKQLQANFDEMVRRARSADVAWMEEDELKKQESELVKTKAEVVQFSRSPSSKG